MNRPVAADYEDITAWLSDLADLARSGSEPVTKSKIAVYAYLLAKDYPPAAFTSASLRAVTEGMEFFPPFDALAKRIGAWWREHKPRQLAITDDGHTNLTERGRAMLRYWNQRKAAGFPPIPGRPDVTDVRSHSASLVRQVAPEAWAVIERGEAA